MKEKIIKLLPMVLVEIYLVFTLVFLKCGPIQYSLQNETKFWFLIFAYHIAFITGYIVIFRCKKTNIMSESQNSKNKIARLYWWVLIIGFLVWLVVYRNGTHANSYIPYELPRNFVQGLLHPADRYYWKLSPEAYAQFHGNKTITMISSVFYPIYYFMPMLLIVLWDNISKTQKILSYVQMFLIMAMGISVGTNKYLFDLLFVVFGGFVLEMICKWKKEGLGFYKKRKIILFTVIFLMIFDVWYFTYNLRDRVGNVNDYIESTNENIEINTEEEESDAKTGGFFNDMIVGLQSYICQGYYGFSVALSEDFTTTYGVGHSNFCLSTLDTVFDIDLAERTYQVKISEQWSSTARWHSFYSQMANDVGLYGVILVMFAIGVILAMAWRDAYYCNNVIAKCLLILFVIMFLYMPANNQLGNVAGTFFAFWETILLWGILKIKKKKSIK